jgi:protein-tyrosine phosphatase
MESIHNFRDFGGYKTRNGLIVKKGLLYRSGSLTKASDNDLKKISALGIKTIIDLRTHQERHSNPEPIPGNSNVTSIHIPIKVRMHNESGLIWQLLSLRFGKARKIDYHEAMRDAYQEYVTDFQPEFSKILKLTSESSNLPILIHCTGGKDRTGFACSLIQQMLDIPIETVLQDYLQTNIFLHEVKDEFRKRLKRFSWLGISIEKVAPLFEARKEFLEAAYDKIIDDFGTINDYIREGLGFSDEERQRLKHLLIQMNS